MSTKAQPHYIILQGSSTTELQLKVNEYLSKDYKPVGGISVTAEMGSMGQAHSRLIQAMLFTPGASTHSNPPGSRSPQKH